MSQTQINFTRGVPALEAFPIEDVSLAAQRAIKKYGQTILQYGKSTGFMPLVEWLANWQGVKPTQILTGNGSLNLIEFMCYHFLQPNDTVFVETPTYDRTLTLLRRHHANIVGIPLEADGINLDALESALKQHAPKFFYVIPDFQNPSGATYSLEKRQRLISLAEKHDFWILEDAPYRPLRYRGDEEPSLFQINPARVLHMLSFSKLVGPGLRVGFVAGDERILRAVSKIAEDTYITPALLGQGIAYQYLSEGHLPAQIAKLKKLYAPRLDATLSALHKYLPDAQSTKPDGGFFLSLTLPEGTNTEKVREIAKEKYALNLASGQAFFAGNGGERFLRLPYCAMTPEALDDGVSRLAAAVKDLG